MVTIEETVVIAGRTWGLVAKAKATIHSKGRKYTAREFFDEVISPGLWDILLENKDSSLLSTPAQQEAVSTFLHWLLIDPIAYASLCGIFAGLQDLADTPEGVNVHDIDRGTKMLMDVYEKDHQIRVAAKKREKKAREGDRNDH